MAPARSLQHERAVKTKHLVCCVILGIGGCTDVPSTQTDEEEVQAELTGWYFELARDGSRASFSTGVVEVPIRNGSGVQVTVPSNQPPPMPASYPVRGTCGVTFISPHYAITASHCVDGDNVPNPSASSLTVRTYNITGVSEDWLLLAPGSLSGTFPNYVPTVGAFVDQIPGYQSTAYSCTVRARCAYQSIPAYNCTTGGDVALLFCGGRAANAPWLPVAPSDPQTGPVDMYWFHEVLYMPIVEPQLGPPSAVERFQHYTRYTPNSPNSVDSKKNNFHYLASRTNGILPLRSLPLPDGTPRRRTGGNGADLYACHGTSGSGVLQVNAQGQHELLGPVSTGALSWVNTRLCTEPQDIQGGTTNITYSPNFRVRALETAWLPTLTDDRFPPPPPPSTCGGVPASQFSCLCGDEACIDDEWTCINCGGGDPEM